MIYEIAQLDSTAKLPIAGRLDDQPSQHKKQPQLQSLAKCCLIGLQRNSFSITLLAAKICPNFLNCEVLAIHTQISFVYDDLSALDRAGVV